MYTGTVAIAYVVAFLGSAVVVITAVAACKQQKRKLFQQIRAVCESTLQSETSMSIQHCRTHTYIEYFINMTLGEMVPCLGLTQTPSLTLCIYVQYVFLYGCVCARICKMHFIIHFVLPSFVFYSRRRVCEYLHVCVIRVFVYLVACRLSCYCLKCVHVSLLCMGVCGCENI